MYWNLFDKMILPILLYGAEIWGFKVHKSIESVQERFCKFVLSLPSKTTNAAALGECGRYPIQVHCVVRVIKFWLKLTCMEADRLRDRVITCCII